MPSSKRWTEKEVCDKFETQLYKVEPTAFFQKIWQGSRSKLGFPDYYVVFCEFSMLLEAKRYGEELEPIQEKVLWDHARAGGAGGMLTIDEAHQNFELHFMGFEHGSKVTVLVTLPLLFTAQEISNALYLHPEDHRNL